jgi:hypothetical protein
VVALIGGVALLGETADAKADSWSTIAHAYDTGRYSTLAHIRTELVPSGIFRTRVKAPKGPVRLTGYLICYYSENDTWYAERDLAWSWRSSGYHYRWHRQRLPEKLTLGPIHDGNAVRCWVRLDASGKGGRLRFQLQRLTG